MSSPDVSLNVEIPSGFSRSDLAAPDLTQSPQLSLGQWESARDTSGHVLAWGCVSADVSAWNADATELAQDKLTELASKTAQTALHTVRASGRERALSSDDGQTTARTFLVFTHDRAHGCFVACTSRECASTVETATVHGALVDPPPPGVTLGALSWAVHHPHEALAAFGALVFLAAALAIATRPGKSKKTKRSHS